jgi:hypothetical protein
MEDAKYPLLTKVLNGTRLFLTLTFLLIVDIYSLKIIRKYVA